MAIAIVIAVLVAVGVNHVVWAVLQWPLGDLEIYLAAATRLRDGESLYQAADTFRSYWYAPWFAVVMIPLTLLPLPFVAALWSAGLVICTLAVGIMLWRRGTPAARLLALMITPALFAVSAGGNIQAPLVLALLMALYRPSGPLWVALAASLKLTPILFTLVYLSRREWIRAGLSILFAAVLLAPAMLLGIPLGRVQEWDQLAPGVLAWGVPIYVLAVAACVIATLVVPPRFAGLAAAAAVVVALPRLFVYDVTMVAVGAAEHRQASAQPSALSLRGQLAAHLDRRQSCRRCAGTGDQTTVGVRPEPRSD